MSSIYESWEEQKEELLEEKEGETREQLASRMFEAGWLEAIQYCKDQMQMVHEALDNL